jgi:N-acetylated-alpha-linked acidic dipeptidase
MLTSEGGLPNRPWFKHQIYAPGFYTGYGVKTIPAVREALEQKQWKEAEDQIVRVGGVLRGMAGHVESIAIDLEQAVK